MDSHPCNSSHLPETENVTSVHRTSEATDDALRTKCRLRSPQNCNRTEDKESSCDGKHQHSTALRFPESTTERIPRDLAPSYLIHSNPAKDKASPVELNISGMIRSDQRHQPIHPYPANEPPYSANNPPYPVAGPLHSPPYPVIESVDAIGWSVSSGPPRREFGWAYDVGSSADDSRNVHSYTANEPPHPARSPAHPLTRTPTAPPYHVIEDNADECLVSSVSPQDGKAFGSGSSAEPPNLTRHSRNEPPHPVIDSDNAVECSVSSGSPQGKLGKALGSGSPAELSNLTHHSKYKPPYSASESPSPVQSPPNSPPHRVVESNNAVECPVGPGSSRRDLVRAFGSSLSAECSNLTRYSRNVPLYLAYEPHYLAKSPPYRDTGAPNTPPHPVIDSDNTVECLVGSGSPQGKLGKALGSGSPAEPSNLTRHSKYKPPHSASESPSQVPSPQNSPPHRVVESNNAVGPGSTRRELGRAFGSSTSAELSNLARYSRNVPSYLAYKSHYLARSPLRPDTRARNSQSDPFIDLLYAYVCLVEAEALQGKQSKACTSRSSVKPPDLLRYSKNEPPKSEKESPNPVPGSPDSTPHRVVESDYAVESSVRSGPLQRELGRAFGSGSSAEPPNLTRLSRNMPPYPMNEPLHPTNSAPYPVTGPPDALPHPVIESDSAVSWSADSGLSKSKIGGAHDFGSAAQRPNLTRSSRNVPPYPTNEPLHPTNSAPDPVTGPPNSLSYPVIESESAVSWSANSGLSKSKTGGAHGFGSAAQRPNLTRSSRNVPPYPTNEPLHPTNSAPYPVTGPPNALPYPVIESDSALKWSANSGLSMSKIGGTHDFGSAAERPNLTRSSRNVPPYPTNEPIHPTNSAPYPVTGPPDALPHPVIESDSAVSWSANSGLLMSKIGSTHDSSSSAELPNLTGPSKNEPPFSVHVPPYPMNSPPYPVTEPPYPSSGKLLAISPENSGLSRMPLPDQPNSDACSMSAPTSLIHNRPRNYRTRGLNRNPDHKRLWMCIFIVIAIAVSIIIYVFVKFGDMRS